MSKYFTITLLLVSGVLCSRAESRNELALALRIEREPFSSESYSLFISGQSASNYVLESSFDLKAWQVNIRRLDGLAQISVHRIGPSGIHEFWSVESQSRQFLRAAPGEFLDRIEQRWLETQPTEYTFRLRYEPCLCPGMISGTVRVRNGAIVEVTDAVDDFTREYISEPDLSRFLTIGQLFEAIRREFESKSEQVQVTYDPSGLFPARIVIDRVIRDADDESIISATDFVVVER